MMRCKIIEIGPQDAFLGDDRGLCGKKGTLKRSDSLPDRWLQGSFTFDDPNVTGQDYLNFYQVRVKPIGAWPR